MTTHTRQLQQYTRSTNNNYTKENLKLVTKHTRQIRILQHVQKVKTPKQEMFSPWEYREDKKKAIQALKVKAVETGRQQCLEVCHIPYTWSRRRSWGSVCCPASGKRSALQTRGDRVWVHSERRWGGTARMSRGVWATRWDVVAPWRAGCVQGDTQTRTAPP